MLLARLAGRTAEDICVGIAVTNRATVKDVAAMDYFANLLPVRMALEAAFVAQIEATKDRLRQAMQNARMPYSVTLETLGLGLSPPTHAPLCQAVFDYKQGRAESGINGDASIVEVDMSRERTVYDVVLERPRHSQRSKLALRARAPQVIFDCLHLSSDECIV